MCWRGEESHSHGRTARALTSVPGAPGIHRVPTPPSTPAWSRVLLQCGGVLIRHHRAHPEIRNPNLPAQKGAPRRGIPGRGRAGGGKEAWGDGERGGAARRRGAAMVDAGKSNLRHLCSSSFCFLLWMSEIHVCPGSSPSSLPPAAFPISHWNLPPPPKNAYFQATRPCRGFSGTQSASQHAHARIHTSTRTHAHTHTKARGPCGRSGGG